MLYKNYIFSYCPVRFFTCFLLFYHFFCKLADQDKQIDTFFIPYPGISFKNIAKFLILSLLDPLPTIKDERVLLLAKMLTCLVLSVT